MALLATPETRPALEAPKEPGPGTGPVQAGENSEGTWRIMPGGW